MTTALFLLVVAVAWLAVACAIGVVTGRAIQRADERVRQHLHDEWLDLEGISFDFPTTKGAQTDETRPGADINPK